MVNYKDPSQFNSQCYKVILIDLVQLSHSGKNLFAISEKGSVATFRFPFDENTNNAIEFNEFASHSRSIAQCRFSFDDQFLFTAGEDGCVFIYRVIDKDQKTKVERNWSFSDEILVSKSDLVENQRVLNELKQKVDELKAESDAQLRSKDIIYANKMQEVQDKFKEEIKSLNLLIAQRKMEMAESEVRQKDEMIETKKHHQVDIKEAISSFEQKIGSEHAHYKSLEDRLNDLHHQWEGRMKDIEFNYHNKVVQITDYYKQQIDQKHSLIQKAKQEFQDHRANYEITVKDIEQDIEKEILQLEFNYEMKLKEERLNLSRVKEENIAMKAHYDLLLTQIEEQKRELAKAGLEEKRIHDIIKSLENDISGLEKEMQERDETLLDKEKRISDLKKKNQELEKFKFVLDYKIIELRKQVQPREQDIVNLTERTEAMKLELKQYETKQKVLKTAYQDLILKHFGTYREKLSEEWRLNMISSVKSNIEHDLYQVFKHIDSLRSFKLLFTELYHKYKNKQYEPPETAPASTLPHASESELLFYLENMKKGPQKQNQVVVKNEFEVHATNKRIQLERTTQMLNQKLKKEQKKRSVAARKMIEENTILTK